MKPLLAVARVPGTLACISRNDIEAQRKQIGNLALSSLRWLPLVLLATLACSAQDKPIAEVSGAYQYDHLRGSTDGESITVNVSRGWDAAVDVPILPWFGAVGDISRVWKTENIGLYTTSCSYFGGCLGAPETVNASILTYGGGPQFTYRSRYVQPFARLILGDAHSSASFFGVSGSVDSFLAAPGGGVDTRLFRSLWLRVGADYLHTSKYGVTVNGVRALGGFTYKFGGDRSSSSQPRSEEQEPHPTVAIMKINALGIMATVGQQQGAEIAEVFPNGVAALAALHHGDVINSVDGKPVKSPMELAAELSGKGHGDKVQLGYLLHGQWQMETAILLP